MQHHRHGRQKRYVGGGLCLPHVAPVRLPGDVCERDAEMGSADEPSPIVPLSVRAARPKPNYSDHRREQHERA